MNQMALKIETGYIPLYLTKVHLTNVLKPWATTNPQNHQDGIVNELLHMLPTEIQETIHMLFIIMWASGFTPKAWKISNTILIDKNKGDATEASSYRPICLANTLYKLWMRLITNTLYEYAEQNPYSAPHKLVFANKKTPFTGSKTWSWH